MIVFFYKFMDVVGLLGLTDLVKWVNTELLEFIYYQNDFQNDPYVTILTYSNINVLIFTDNYMDTVFKICKNKG